MTRNVNIGSKSGIGQIFSRISVQNPNVSFFEALEQSNIKLPPLRSPSRICDQPLTSAPKILFGLILVEWNIKDCHISPERSV